MAIGNSDFSRDFMAGASLARMAQERQERMIALRAQAARDALTERQVVQELQMKTEQFKQQQEIKSHVDAVFGAAADTYSTLAPEIGHDAAQEFIDRGVANDPYAGPIMMKMREQQAQAQMETAHAKEYEATATGKGGFKASVYQPMDMTTGKPALTREGKPLRMVSTGAGSAKELDNTPQTGLAAQIMHIHQAQLDAEASGNKPLAKAMEAGLAKLTESNKLSLKFDESGHISEIVQGAQGGTDMTTATKTAAQQSLQAATDVVDLGNQLLPLMSNETMGLEAAAKNVVFDKLLAQKFPELASKDRAKATSLATELRAKAVRMNRSDGNINKDERNEILQAFPKINDPINSAANAQNSIRMAVELSASHAVIGALRLKQPIPVTAAQSLDDETIGKLYDRGLITSAEAVQIGKLKRGAR